MALNTIAGFHIGGTEPIDDKFLLSKAQMLTFDDNIAPQSFLSCCTDDNKVYQYVKTNTVDETTGKFRLFEGGGGGSTIQFDTLPEHPTNGQIIQWIGETDEHYINGCFYKFELTEIVTWIDLISNIKYFEPDSYYSTYNAVSGTSVTYNGTKIAKIAGSNSYFLFDEENNNIDSVYMNDEIDKSIVSISPNAGTWTNIDTFPSWRGTSEELEEALEDLPVNTRIEVTDDYDEDFSKKSITIFICDSFGDTDTDEEDITEFLPECFAKYTGGLINGVNYFISFDDGAGFVAKGLRNKNFLDCLQELENSIVNKNLVKNIIVAGGWNDGNKTSSNIAIKIAEFAEYAKRTYSNALISLFHTAWTDTTSTRQMFANNTIPVYQKCASISKTSNMRYINGSEFMNHNYSLISTDNCHPTKEGYQHLGQCMAEGYIQGSVYPRYIDCNTFINPLFKIRAQHGDELLDISGTIQETNDSFIINYALGSYLNYAIPYDSTQSNFHFGQFEKIGELSEDVANFIRGNEEHYSWVMTNFVVYFSDDTNEICSGILQFYGKYIYIFIAAPNSTISEKTINGVFIQAGNIIYSKLCS